MRRQLMCVMLTAAVLVGGALHVQAAERTGSVRVILDYGDGQARNAAVSLCRVGEPSAAGYRLLEAFGGGIIKEEDIQAPALAQWLAEIPASDAIERILDADGSAEYTALEKGLYLLVQSETASGYYPVEPFLIPVPYQGQWDLTAMPKMQAIVTESPRTGQHPAPIIGAMGLVLSGLGIVVCFEKIKKK